MGPRAHPHLKVHLECIQPQELLYKLHIEVYENAMQTCAATVFLISVWIKKFPFHPFHQLMDFLSESCNRPSSTGLPPCPAVVGNCYQWWPAKGPSQFWISLPLEIFLATPFSDGLLRSHSIIYLTWAELFIQLLCVLLLCLLLLLLLLWFAIWFTFILFVFYSILFILVWCAFHCKPWWSLF